MAESEPIYLTSRRNIVHASDDGGESTRCGSGTRDLRAPDAVALLVTERYCKRCFRPAEPTEEA